MQIKTIAEIITAINVSYFDICVKHLSELLREVLIDLFYNSFTFLLMIVDLGF